MQRFAQDGVDGLQVVLQCGLEQWNGHVRRLGGADRVRTLAALKAAAAKPASATPVVYPKPEPHPAPGAALTSMA
jgi:hypothetical protein